MSEIHRADPALRRHAVVVVLVIAALLATGLVVLQRWYASVALLPPDDAWAELLSVVTWIGIVILLFVIAASVYALRLGGRIKRAGQYPLPGARTIRDTAILDGKPARSRGNHIQAIGAMLLVLAVLLLVLCFRLASTFAGLATQ
jgi:hypothetical protein